MCRYLLTNRDDDDIIIIAAAYVSFVSCFYRRRRRSQMIGSITKFERVSGTVGTLTRLFKLPRIFNTYEKSRMMKNKCLPSSPSLHERSTDTPRLKYIITGPRICMRNKNVKVCEIFTWLLLPKYVRKNIGYLPNEFVFYISF